MEIVIAILLESPSEDLVDMNGEEFADDEDEDDFNE